MGANTELYRRIVSAKLYIDKNFHEDINLDSISGQAYLSRFHFHRLFTRVYKKTPHQYLTYRRLQEARLLLAGNQLSVAEICARIGFQSPRSFSILFKRFCGQSPVHFRQSQKKKKDQITTEPRAFIPHCFIDQYLVGSRI